MPHQDWKGLRIVANSGILIGALSKDDFMFVVTVIITVLSMLLDYWQYRDERLARGIAESGEPVPKGRARARARAEGEQIEA